MLRYMTYLLEGDPDSRVLFGRLKKKALYSMKYSVSGEVVNKIVSAIAKITL